MPKSRRIVLVLVLILSGLTPAAVCQTYRNIALNPNDVHASGHGFPHASSNNEYNCNYDITPNCVADSTFWAKNAIDGNTNNSCHGSLPNCGSWGPQMLNSLWWRVDFGHDVQVDKVVIWIRHDFPHDSYWKDATLVFSDSSKVLIHPDSVAAPQTFTFTSRTIKTLTITNLVPFENKWCAFAEVQVWGYDPPTSVTIPLSGAHISAFAAPSTICLLPGISSSRLRVPAGTSRVELYSVLGRKVWERSCEPGTGQTLIDLPRNLPQGVLQARYVKED